MHRQLERKTDFVLRPVDMYRHAVLCYQTGVFPEGAERFRRLRAHVRQMGFSALRLREYWWDARRRKRPRKTFVKVLRITTEFRAEGYIQDLDQNVMLRPRQFTPPPKVKEVVECHIRFDFNGPLAVSPRFFDSSS